MKLVYTIEPASASMISSLSQHCSVRSKDGSSDIDLDRSHLNKILVGSKSINASLKAFYDGGVKRAAKQAEKPFLRLVVSASKEYFSSDEKLEEWTKATLEQLQREHAQDLVHVELHLDETTPHLHAIIAPTYFKKKRMPGRKRRNETYKQFMFRKLEVQFDDRGPRTVGRASHATLSKQYSFQKLRKNMHEAVKHLGIEYGDENVLVNRTSTRSWVKKEAKKIEGQRSKLKDAVEIIKERKQALESKKADFDTRFCKLKQNLVSREFILQKREQEQEREHKAFKIKKQALVDDIAKQRVLKKETLLLDQETIEKQRVLNKETLLLDTRKNTLDQEIVEKQRVLNKETSLLDARVNAVSKRENYLSKVEKQISEITHKLAEKLSVSVSSSLTSILQHIRSIKPEPEPEPEQNDDDLSMSF